MAGGAVGQRPFDCIEVVFHSSQPQLDTVIRIAELLDVDIKELINK